MQQVIVVACVNVYEGLDCSQVTYSHATCFPEQTAVGNVLSLVLAMPVISIGVVVARVG